MAASTNPRAILPKPKRKDAKGAKNSRKLEPPRHRGSPVRNLGEGSTLRAGSQALRGFATTPSATTLADLRTLCRFALNEPTLHGSTGARAERLRLDAHALRDVDEEIAEG